jgi:hypothetical protein
MRRHIKVTAGIAIAAIVLAGCASTGGGSSAKSDSAPAAAAPTTKVGPGMDANGVVVDASKVESGYGQKVKGLGDWDGEITGVVIPGSPFSKLQIGMPLQQVIDTAGHPTDQGAYITGKAFIPFYFGSDRYRFEYVYKGQGRLIFAGGSAGDFTSGHLIWIIYSPSEGGYR